MLAPGLVGVLPTTVGTVFLNALACFETRGEMFGTVVQYGRYGSLC